MLVYDFKKIFMPIEIRELNISVQVQDDAQKSNSDLAGGAAIQTNYIIAECVEQVLNILKEKMER